MAIGGPKLLPLVVRELVRARLVLGPCVPYGWEGALTIGWGNQPPPGPLRRAVRYCALGVAAVIQVEVRRRMIF